MTDASGSGGGRQRLVDLRPFAGLNRSNVVRELLAGVSLIAIAVPLNIGYAQIAGLPPTAGLYALVVPTLVYVLLVSSRQLVVSPDAAASALVFSSLLALGASGDDLLVMAGAQAILGGLVLLAAGLFRLGFLSEFLSRPILIGFVSGLAAEIMLSQVAKMLGVKLSAEGEFFTHLVELFGLIPHVHLWSLAVSVVSLAILVVGRRTVAAVPWALVVIVVTTAASMLFGLPEFGVAVLGHVEAGPPKFAVPMLPLQTWLALVPSALALAMVAMAEGLLMSRAYAERNRYPNLPDQNLIAMGAANIAAGFSSSYSIGSSGSRTAAMDAAGSRTQLPGLVLVAGALALLVFGTDLLAGVPSPAIGAIVAVAVWGLLGIGDYRYLWRMSRSEFAVALVCALGVLVVGPLGGIGISFVLALVNLVRRAANPPIDVLVGHDDPQVSLSRIAPSGTHTVPGVVILRFAAPLFFANGNRLVESAKDAVRLAPEPVRTLVLDLEAVTDIDVTGAGSLATLREWLDAQGIALAYSRVRDDLAVLLEHYDLAGGTTRYTSNREAAAALAGPAEQPPTDEE
ncbi:MAG: SulP family inorganic anion transporter [Propionibacteriaceae bacterium]|nr:SulP family inorganic anion transporter [Propionibacteriaceae bacterium]